MLVWVEECIRKKVGSLATRGRSAPTVNDYFLDAMYLGGPARSGQRRVPFTTDKEDIARLAIEVARLWWYYTDGDEALAGTARGFRWMPVHFFVHRAARR